jgi:serine/threonine protein kinase
MSCRPGNVLWRPATNSWTLVDFGCAGRLGKLLYLLHLQCNLHALLLKHMMFNSSRLPCFASKARTMPCKCQPWEGAAGDEEPLKYSLHYAAPELVCAARAGSSSGTVSAEADVWGIGIIAWELLTSERVFPPGIEAAAVTETFLGDRQLPWEAPDAAARLVPRLRVLRRSVLMCLSRKPRERPTSRELLGSWNGMFESLTGTTRDAFAGGTGRLGAQSRRQQA